MIRGTVLAVVPLALACTACREPPESDLADAGDTPEDAEPDTAAPACVFEGEFVSVGLWGCAIEAAAMEGGFGAVINSATGGIAGTSYDFDFQIVRRAAAGGNLPVVHVAEGMNPAAGLWNGEEFGVLAYNPGITTVPDFVRLSAAGAIVFAVELAESCWTEGPMFSVLACRLELVDGGWVLLDAETRGTLSWRALAPDGALGPAVGWAIPELQRGVAWGGERVGVLCRRSAERAYDVVVLDRLAVASGPAVRLEGIDADRAIYGGPLAPTATGFVMAYVVAADEVTAPEACATGSCPADVRLLFLSASGEAIGRPIAVERTVLPAATPEARSPVAALEGSGPEALVVFRFAAADGSETLRLRAVRPDGVVSEAVDLFSDSPWFAMIRRAGDDLFVGTCREFGSEGGLESTAWLGTCL